MALARIPVITAALLLAGCTSMPERPVLPVIDAAAGFAAPLPDTFDAGAEPWWLRVVNAQTQQLILTALAGSPGLREAAQRVTAAQARLAQADADRGGRAVLDADATLLDNRETSNESLQLGVDASVPIDVSGALERRREAAQARLLAQRAGLAQSRMELARDYLLALIDSHEARQRTLLLNKQVEVAGTLLRLIELRFSQGLASSVDVLQQRDQRAALRQQLPIAARDRWTADNQLRRLAGRAPGDTDIVDDETLPLVGTAFALVAPAALVETRPDLRASAAQVAAADADFAAALADRLPTLTLSGGALRRVVSGDYTTLLSAALGAAFTLFDAGNTRAIAVERRAELAALGERHLALWLDAVFDVDDLLFETASLEERLTLSSQRLTSAQQLLGAAQRRYERGVSDYLPVLEALRGLQQQQRDDLALRAELHRARTRLHHALGQPAPITANATGAQRSNPEMLELTA